MKLTGESEHLDFLRDHYLDRPRFDVALDTSNQFEFTSNSGGTAAVADGVDEQVTLTPSTGTSDNDEAYLASKYEKFKFLADRPIHFEQDVQYAEANTDDANVIIGFKDAVGADTLLNDGGGPAASYYGCVFFKVDGGTVWNAEVSIGGTQYTKTLDADVAINNIAQTAGGSAFVKFEIDVYPKGGSSGGKFDAVFSIGGIPVAKFTDIDDGTPTEMQPFFGLKLGSAVQQTIVGRPWMCYQKR